MSAGEAISGPNRPEGYIADNRLLIWISVSAPQADGLTSRRLPTAWGRRVKGSPQRLRRWPDRDAAPQRTHTTTTWTHHPADVYPGLRGPVGSSRSTALCPHKATSSHEGPGLGPATTWSAQAHLPPGTGPGFSTQTWGPGPHGPALPLPRPPLGFPSSRARHHPSGRIRARPMQ